MYEFNIEDPVEDMDEADLRSTLNEFMEKHEENRADYAEVEADRDEFGEKVDDLEDEVAAFSDTESTLIDKFAAVVSDETPMFDADEVAERFSLPELLNKADAMGAFSLSAETVEDDPDDDDDGLTFAEREERSQTGSGGSGGSGGNFTDEASKDLDAILGL
jgi:predicted nuclease with TOPRIM domain